MDEETILAAIGSTEETTFSEFCKALEGDCPDDKNGWRDLFNTLRQLERDGFVEVSRVDGKIDSMILSEAGANRIREKLDSRRELFTIPGI